MDQRVLFCQIHIVALYQRITIFHYVAVLASFSVQWVEADPRADFRIIIAHHGAKIAVALAQLTDQLPGGLLVCALRRHVLPGVIDPALGDIADDVLVVVQRIQIPDQLADRLPIVTRLHDRQRFYTIGIYDDIVV